MSATKLNDAGFTDLVSVTPPGVEISAKSKLDPTQLGKAPGKKGKAGWFGYAFTKEKVDVEKIERWGANVGLLGDSFPALDIDSKSPKLTDAVLRVAANLLGRAPCRLSVDPRRLLVYRTDHPFARMALTIEYEGEQHLIEFLGKGRQYLVHGTHPSGEKYRWCNDVNGWEPDHKIGDLWDMVPEELPRIDADMALRFLEQMRDGLREKGVTCEVVGDGKEAAEKAPPQDDLLAPSNEALIAVVDRIPNTQEVSPDREHYLQMGYAIKAAAGGAGFEIFADWCRKREPDERVEGNPETWTRDFDRMQGPFRVGWAWLQEQAERWSTYYAAADEFEADPDLADTYEADVAEVVEDDDEPQPDLPPPVMSDAMLADIAMQVVGEGVRYVELNKRWHVWNRSAWVPDNTQQIRTKSWQMMLHEATRYRDAARAARNDRQRKQFNKTAESLESLPTLNRIVDILSFQPGVGVEPEAFDSEPWVLNTPGKTILLEDDGIKVVDNAPHFMCAKATATTPKKGEPTLWLQFLQETTGGDDELILYLQKFCGYCLTGVVREQFLPYIHGRANTGKSVFVKTLEGVLGSYWKAGTLDLLTSKKDRHPAELAELQGARIVTMSETQEGRAWDEQLLKMVTSGDAMMAHRKYGQPFTLYPSCKFIVTGNHKPAIANLDEAMQRRLHVVPFSQVVPVEKRDPSLPEKLEQEWGKILLWMLEGYVTWRQEGLEPPEAVMRHTKDYFLDEDTVGQWLAECCEYDNEYETHAQQLYSSWEQWCNARGYRPGSQRTLTGKLKERMGTAPFDYSENVLIGKHRARGFRGVRVKPWQEEGIDGDFD